MDGNSMTIWWLDGGLECLVVNSLVKPKVASAMDAYSWVGNYLYVTNFLDHIGEKITNVQSFLSNIYL